MMERLIADLGLGYLKFDHNMDVTQGTTSMPTALATERSVTSARCCGGCESSWNGIQVS
jgi:hypothetical protein